MKMKNLRKKRQNMEVQKLQKSEEKITEQSPNKNKK